MKNLNEAGWDRVVRVVIGVVLLVLGLGGYVTGGWGIALSIIGLVLSITGLIGWCPIYAILKTGTKSKISA